MSIIAPIEDGKVVNSTSNKTGAKSPAGGAMDKEAFLQLLVAQMKYQDPLQPTSNTEYIAQYAQFSQVESLSNMSSNMDLQRASSLVGQQVYVKSTDTSGETRYIQGKVDYVSFENGNAYVYINEQAYELSEVETVVDPEYMEAYDLATEFVTDLNKLPSVANVSLSDGEQIDTLAKVYNNMTTYQKEFVATEKVEALRAYIAKIDELRKASEGE